MQSQLGGNQHIFGLKQAFTAKELFVGIQDFIQVGSWGKNLWQVLLQDRKSVEALVYLWNRGMLLGRTHGTHKTQRTHRTYVLVHNQQQLSMVFQ